MDTLWFARACDGSDDYSRMARQKCVMNAMLQQISPQDALRNFSKIAAASSEMISTSVPKSEVDRFLDLAIKAKSQKIGTVSLVPPKVVTADPDIDVVHAMVADAIDRAEGEQPTPEPTTEAAPPAKGGKAPVATTPAPVTGGSVGSLKDGYAANRADDLGSVC
ncbi:hypothetical protein [Nocardioides sp. B-3]|uniref:hypothetical protein n=1 Tax=Nocardioides sp. B-3 TaxID=2895565 RepID=UPI0021535118|nr:hypothetical protein [Nocardioides sp. B-3]UUZ61898.1 hypothetical protein LP418_17595 [Nocardioides sp. B-3]